MKKLISLVLVCLMLIPMAVSAFALEADDSITANWNPMAAKYSKGTWKIIAPKSGNYAIKSEGFTFTENEEGGIKVTTPDYETFAGTYATSVVTSKATTALDGLSVVITPDEYDSMIDTIDAGNSIGVLWTEENIDSIAQFNDASKAYDKGLYDAVSAYSNGLRHMIPVVDNDDKLVPAYQKPELANGKALYVRLTCDRAIGEDYAPIATSVSIVYYDGYYINDDGHPGYRWTFTAKNHEDSLLGDSSMISRGFESIDLRNGIAINVRADETLGFIVNINGYDFYKGEEVAFFPDCDTNWVGYTTKNLTDVEIENEAPIWTTSMSYARDDIDLNGLKDAGAGYVTVGAVSNNDQNLADHRCNYTIDTINGVPAAKWAGEATPAHECNFEKVVTIGATCTRDGYDYYRCTVCGAAKNENAVPALGHHPKEDITTLIKPTCDAEGRGVRVCFVCRTRLERFVLDKVPHTFTKEWTGDFTCENGGTRTNTCDVCNQVVTETLEAGHVYDWVEVTAATCTTPGTEKQVCTVCGAEGETRETAIDPEAHVSNDWTPVVVDGAWNGLEKSVCTACGLSAERTVEVFDYIKHFTDVKQDAWYEDEVAYCVQQGIVNGMTETTFVPNGMLTRAQFLTLLAAVDGVDLSAYEGKNAGFEDVKPSHWWNEEICWAVENGITSGISETKFGPSNNVTRSQLARFFYVYTEKTGGDVDGRADISAYPDANKVQSWAQEPVQWAVDAGLIAGVNKNGVDYLDPNGNATRAQAARMFMLFTQLGCEHVWGDWEVVTEATFTEVGSEKRVCTLCGEIETREIPVKECEHTWGEWVVVTKPTHEVTGVQARTCDVCGAVEEETIPVKDYVITFDFYPEDLEAGATIDEGFEPICPINYGDDYNDVYGDFPTASMGDSVFVGWFLEEYNFLMTKEEWDGNSYALTSDCTIYAIFEDPVPKMFTLVFDVDGDLETTDDTLATVGADIGDLYSEIIDELPTVDQEGMVFKGWWNRNRRIAITPTTAEDKAFDVYIKTDSDTGLPEATIDEIEKTIVLIPIMDTEGEKDWTITFENWEVEDFEPIVYKMNVGDYYMTIFAGDFPSPGVFALDEWTEFAGWYIEEVNFMLTEGDMWDEGYLALDGDWTFEALYLEV